ncbi:hypothetical protein VPHK469_0186 [Vibrio phage K469]
MQIIKTLNGLRLDKPFIKPMIGDTHCLVSIKAGEFTVYENLPISRVLESTNSDRVWYVGLDGRSIEASNSSIGTVIAYGEDMVSITCTLENVEAAKALLDEYMLTVELDKLRATRSKLRQHQASVKLLSGRIESRKDDK